MVGGFSRPKKDKAVKVSAGQAVKAGQILCRGLAQYKAGVNVKSAAAALHAALAGKVFFSRKKTRRGKVHTYLNVRP